LRPLPDGDAHQLLAEILRLENKNREAAAESKRAEDLLKDKAATDASK
jgi:hypothetical protein